MQMSKLPFGFSLIRFESMNSLVFGSNLFNVGEKFDGGWSRGRIVIDNTLLLLWLLTASKCVDRFSISPIMSRVLAVDGTSADEDPLQESRRDSLRMREW